ncbi:MAG: hypothetical protein EPN30_00410 [Actinomycetota bacterium]|nr:MAG: hypothetical protein EPN30_00410 [Actinomycetota bacterium]
MKYAIGEALPEQERSKEGRPSLLMRRLLMVPEVKRSPAQEKRAERLFSFAILISALRCTLSYVILPFVIPLFGLGATVGVGPVIGIPLGAVAIFFDVKGIRRFWIAQHRYRWQMTIIYLLVIALVLYLVVRDIVHLT